MSFFFFAGILVKRIGTIGVGLGRQPLCPYQPDGNYQGTDSADGHCGMLSEM